MKKKNIILITSIIFFMAALALPAVYTQKGSEVDGLSCFLMGWLDLYGNGISWLANPALIFSWIFLLMGKPKVVAALGLVATGFALYYLMEKEITLYEKGSSYHYLITSYGAGYFLWLASCATVFLSSLLLLRSKTAEMPEVRN